MATEKKRENLKFQINFQWRIKIYRIYDYSKTRIGFQMLENLGRQVINFLLKIQQNL